MRHHTRNTQDNRKKKSTLSNVEALENTEFETADGEDDTDYGLEFTTSRFEELKTSPRISTPRRLWQDRHNEDLSEESDDAQYQLPETTPLRHRQRSVTAPNKATSRRKQTNPAKRMAKLHHEIARLQNTDKFLIPRLPFSRLVREIMMETTRTTFRMTVGALDAMQTATEMYLTQRFQDAYLLTQYRSRVTLQVRDMALVAYFCRTYGNP